MIVESPSRQGSDPLPRGIPALTCTFLRGPISRTGLTRSFVSSGNDGGGKRAKGAKGTEFGAPIDANFYDELLLLDAVQLFMMFIAKRTVAHKKHRRRRMDMTKIAIVDMATGQIDPTVRSPPPTGNQCVADATTRQRAPRGCEIQQGDHPEVVVQGV